jgi:hypothetical protein
MRFATASKPAADRASSPAIERILIFQNRRAFVARLFVI